MMTDIPESVTLVPIDRIEVLNSRDRNMKVFEEIVENIRSIGLKKPITVTEREGAFIMSLAENIARRGQPLQSGTPPLLTSEF